jgi:hypothetical protein
LRQNAIGTKRLWDKLSWDKMLHGQNAIGTKRLKKNAIGTKRLEKNAIMTKRPWDKTQLGRFVPCCGTFCAVLWHILCLPVAHNSKKNNY